MGFPLISNVSDILEAIKGREDFRIVRRDNYTYAHYMVSFPDTFPTPDTKDESLNDKYRIRRECRGIKFNNDTGNVISRPYHKFFNVNERDETQSFKIDLSKPHIILDKLDGSMICPIQVDSKIFWVSKKGSPDLHNQIHVFVEDKKNYDDFARKMTTENMTPIFEWCSIKQKIVIDYPVDMLVLTAIRNNYSGEYMLYPEMLKVAGQYDIPVVRACRGDVGDFASFLDETAGLDGEEGRVIRFDSGEMYKIKADKYRELHSSLDGLKFEKDVLRILLGDKIDDLKPVVAPDVAERLDIFHASVVKGLKSTAEKIWWEARAGIDKVNGSRKRYSTEIVEEYCRKNGSIYRGFLFDTFGKIDDGVDAVYERLVEYVKNKSSSQTYVDNSRILWGEAKWSSIVIDPEG